MPSIAIDFDALNGGFLLSGEADPVWAGDIDRMFVRWCRPDIPAGRVIWRSGPRAGPN